jgi:hypothetical protein
MRIGLSFPVFLIAVLANDLLAAIRHPSPIATISKLLTKPKKGGAIGPVVTAQLNPAPAP